MMTNQWNTKSRTSHDFLTGILGHFLSFEASTMVLFWVFGFVFCLLLLLFSFFCFFNRTSQQCTAVNKANENHGASIVGWNCGMKEQQSDSIIQILQLDLLVDVLLSLFFPTGNRQEIWRTSLVRLCDCVSKPDTTIEGLLHKNSGSMSSALKPSGDSCFVTKEITSPASRQKVKYQQSIWQPARR